MSMKYEQEISWEPALITFVFSKSDARAGRTEKLAQLFHSWFKNKQQLNINNCQCSYTFLTIFEGKKTKTHIPFLCEWVCEECLPYLYNFIKASMPELEK